MKRKNIAAVVVLAAVILICVSSPFFVSWLLDEVKVGEIQTDPTPTYDRKEQLSLTEELQICSRPESVVESRPDDLKSVFTEAFRMKNPGVYSIVKNEIPKLQKQESITDVLAWIFDGNVQWGYKVYTYADAQGNYVTVWQVTMEGEQGYVEMEILADYGKVISLRCMNVEKIFRYGIMEEPEGRFLFAEQWGEYLGLESESGAEDDKGLFVQYRDEKGETVIYGITYTRDSLFVSLENRQDIGEKEIDAPGEW